MSSDLAMKAGWGIGCWALVLSMQVPAFAQQQPTTPGIYVSLEGSRQFVNLPAFGIGLQSSDGFATSVAKGPVNAFDVDATGNGIAGSIGYRFAPGFFPPALGSNVRVEIGGSWIEARNEAHVDATVQGYGLIHLDGRNAFGQGFCGGPGCGVSGVLSVDYTAWAINANVASVHKFADLTVTPSLQAFAGRASSAHAFSQNLLNGAGEVLGTYSASTNLRWTDWGARAGLDGTAHLAPWLRITLSGSVGIAARRVSFSGSDVDEDFSPFHASNANDRASTAAFLANTEVRITAFATPFVELTGFVGLNYDSRVPGVTTPSFSLPLQGNQGLLGAPAGIGFADETSYYAGGGVTVRW